MGVNGKKLSERFMYYAGILAAIAPVEDMKHIQNLIEAEEEGRLSMDDGENKVLTITRDILKITDEDFEEMREVAKGQKEYCSPLKPKTQKWQNDLGEYNDKVLDKVAELKALLETGSSLWIGRYE